MIVFNLMSFFLKKEIITVSVNVLRVLCLFLFTRNLVGNCLFSTKQIVKQENTYLPSNPNAFETKIDREHGSSLRVG